MELHQLRYLVLLSEELSFTRAAARGNVAQPALSRQIQKLEDELGVPLVDRTSRRVSLTPTGAEVVEHARRILDEVDATRTAVAGRDGAAARPAHARRDADARAVRRRRGAGRRSTSDIQTVELSLKEELSVGLADRLRRDELDLAIVSGDPGARARGTGAAAAVVASRSRSCSHPTTASRPAPGCASATWPAEPLRRLPTRRDDPRDLRAGGRARAGFTPTIALESNDTARIRALVVPRPRHHPPPHHRRRPPRPTDRRPPPPRHPPHPRPSTSPTAANATSHPPPPPSPPASSRGRRAAPCHGRT